MDIKQDLAAQVRALESENAQLRLALNGRIVIEQAKGALSVTLGVSIDEAFETLKQQARSQHRDIHWVAAEVVRNHGHFFPAKRAERRSLGRPAGP